MKTDKAEVYRKAAEIIIRDGRTVGSLTERGDASEYIADRSLPVCAIGACYRAHYELYGEHLPAEGPMDGERTYYYEFRVQWLGKGGEMRDRTIFSVNDGDGASDEDIALLLKRHAEEVDSA